MKSKSLLRPGGWGSIAVALAFSMSMLAIGVTDEVPIGSVEGTVTMAESGRPLPKATVILRPTFAIEDWEAATRVIETDAKGHFKLRNIAAGSYSVESYSKAHTLTNTDLTVPEGETRVVDLALKPNDPYLDVYDAEHVYTPTERGALHVRGFSPSDGMVISVYKVKFSALERAKSLRDVLSPVASSYSSDLKDPESSEDFERVQKIDWPIKSRDGEGVFDERVTLPQLPEDIYYVRLACGTLKKSSWMQISKMALVTKHSAGQMTVFASELDSGKPVGGASIAYYGPHGKQTVGITSSDGILSFPMPQVSDSGAEVAVVASHGASRAICTMYSESLRNDSNTKIWFVTDRPIYRPGDTVQFKGIARELDGYQYRLPDAGTAQAVIRGPDDSIIDRTQLSVSDRGVLAGQFKTLEYQTGSYTIQVEFNGRKETEYVLVSAYRKSEYKITVTPLKPFYIRGEAVQMRVKCEYYFGGPVVGAELNASIYAAPIWMDPWTEEGDEYYDEGGYSGDYVGAVDGKTNEKGEAILSFDPPDEKGPLTRFEDNDVSLTFNVSATDIGDKWFEGSGSVKLCRGEFALSASPDVYVISPEDEITIDLSAISQAGSKPVEGLVVTVDSGFEEWRDTESRFIKTSNMTVRTDADGKAQARVTARRPGEFVAVCWAKDSRGNLVQSKVYVYCVAPGDYEISGPAPKLEVTLDKKKYRPGDVATALVRAEKGGGHALVTIEGGKLLFQQVVPVHGPATKVSIPVRPDFGPNAYVCVAYVREKKFMEAQRLIALDTSLNELKVSIRPNTDTLKPGQSVRYDVTTTTTEGEPMPAEFSLSVVDESIYAIREDDKDPLRAFYPKVQHGVSTTYSFPELYLDGGDKSINESEIRKEFLDTAFWAPILRTDSSGKLSINVKLPDNLTSWRATVIAVSDETAVGKATCNVRVRKELMARLSLPTYFVEGDEVRISASIHNETGKDQPVTVDLRAIGLQINGASKQTVATQNGKMVTVRWTATALDQPSAEATVSVRAGTGQSDAMRLSRTIVPHGRETIKFKAGELEGEAVIPLARINGAKVGSLKIQLTPTLAGALLESIDELVDYPYGCTEQTMSRFMPAVVVANALRDLNMPRPELETKIADVARKSLQRLRTLQHGDGGFGWWENDYSEPSMTALVLEGLARCQSAGLEIDKFMLERAKKWAENYLTKGAEDASNRSVWRPNTRLEDRLYLAYAIRLDGGLAVADKLFASTPIDGISAEALSYLALGASQSSAPELQAIARRAVARLGRMAQESGATASWPEDYGLETTARALQALVSVEPENPLIAKVLRYLMLARRGDSWYSTRDTAMILVAAARRMRQTGELSATGTASIRLNGETLATYDISPQNAMQTPSYTCDVTKLRDGDNELQLVSSLGKPLYYSVQLRQVPRQERIGEVVSDTGIKMTRTFHRLAANRFEDGTLRLMPEKSNQTRFESGEPIRVMVKITTNRPLEFVMIEIPTPANCRVNENEAPEYWNWWWSGMTVLDDRVTFFVRSLPHGEHTIEYNMMAETPGTASALPPTFVQMYAPENRASPSEQRIEVTER